MLAASALVVAISLSPTEEPPEPPAKFQVVTSASSSVTSLSRQELARLFLKKTTRWKDGAEVRAVDQSSRSAVRAAFTREILKSEGLTHLSAVEGYWRQQVFSGRGVPPPIKSSDADVLDFVAKNPGAIGYVSEQTELGRDVKAVSLH